MEKNRIAQVLKSHYNAILLSILLLLAAQIWSLSSSVLVNIDNGWTAEVSDTLSMQGKLASPSWEGFLQLENYFYWRPPLYFILEAAVFKLLGFGLTQVSLLNSFIIFATFLVLVSLARRRFGSEASLIAGIALASNFIYLLHTIFHGRPDSFVGLLNLLSMYFLLDYSDRRDDKHLMLSALFASLSFLAHEIGALMLISIAANLAILHRNKMRLLFGQLLKIAGVFLITLIPWLLYILNNFNAFLAQWQWLLGRHGGILKVLADEIVRYEWVLTTNSGAMLPWFALMLLVIAFIIYKRDFSVISIAIFTHLLLFPFIGNKATYYFISIVPLVALQAGKFASSLEGKELKMLYAAVLIAFLGSLFAFYAFSTSVSEKYDFPLAFDYLQKQGYGKVIAQPAFYYAFRDKMYSAYAIFNRLEQGEQLDAILESTGAQYVIYDPANLDMGSPPEFKDYLGGRARKVETICAIKHKLLRGEACNSNEYRIGIYRIA